MTIFFAWTKPQEDFDKQIHCREDLKIFNLIISQRESEIALAKIKIASTELIDAFKHSYAFISYKDEENNITLLFKGKITDFPLALEEDWCEIELAAVPLDAENQLTKLTETLKNAPYYDELFIKADNKNPVDVLEARQDLFYWNRCTGEVTLSNIFYGKRQLNLSSYILKDTLKFNLVNIPLKSVQVNLSAEWIQKTSGEINIFPKISQKFSQGIINTLTPNSLKFNWPQVGDKLGQEGTRKESGYQVVVSELKSFTPPTTGILGVYPTTTSEIMTKKDDKIQPVRLQRFWFKGKLHLDWRYRQKRKETVYFTIKQPEHLLSYTNSGQKILDLKLQKLTCDHNKNLISEDLASFFTTKRGRLAIDHAIEVACAHLAGSARCIDIEFQVPFQYLKDITLDNSVSLELKELPFKFITAKVVEYKLIFTSQGAIGWLKLSTTLEQQQTSLSFSTTVENYCTDRYVEEESEQFQRSPSGIIYSIKNLQTPKDKFAFGKNLSIDDIVESIEVINQGNEQITYLKNNEIPYSTSLQHTLNSCVTTINLKLLDLRTKDVLHHQISLNILNSWTAPTQIKT